MKLTDNDRAMLDGENGPGPQLAMRLLVEVGRAQGAPELIDISGAHIDGCLYHGQATVDFAVELAESGAEVAVPTTLNVSSLDLIHPDLYRGSAESARDSRRQMDAYVAMGCRPTWTCGPYQLSDRPAFGDQLAWGESNAIVFANSVLGARTERYGDFMDICCAITGRAPNVGLHTDEGRRATLLVDLDVQDRILEEELLYPVLGGAVGEVAGTDVPVIVGLDSRAGEDRLKALGAAAASTGAVSMFHAVGVTPEAETLEHALRGDEPRRRISIGDGDLERVRQLFDRDQGPLGAISIGTPHFSISEFEELDGLVAGAKTAVPFYVNTGRDVFSRVTEMGITERLEDFGATVVTDTCVYVTSIIGDVEGVVMTNSGKTAFYAPGNLGVDIAFGSLGECVESAVAGRVVKRSVFA